MNTPALWGIVSTLGGFGGMAATHGRLGSACSHAFNKQKLETTPSNVSPVSAALIV